MSRIVGLTTHDLRFPTAEYYFERTECGAGVQDMRFQELMPDVLHWLGVKRIDRFISMSNMKYDAIVGHGIEIFSALLFPKRIFPQIRKLKWMQRKQRVISLMASAFRE